jgi:hypothetical protein
MASPTSKPEAPVAQATPPSMGSVPTTPEQKKDTIAPNSINIPELSSSSEAAEPTSTTAALGDSDDNAPEAHSGVASKVVSADIEPASFTSIEVSGEPQITSAADVGEPEVSQMTSPVIQPAVNPDIETLVKTTVEPVMEVPAIDDTTRIPENFSTTAQSPTSGINDHDNQGLGRLDDGPSPLNGAPTSDHERASVSKQAPRGEEVPMAENVIDLTGDDEPDLQIPSALIPIKQEIQNEIMGSDYLPDFDFDTLPSIEGDRNDAVAMDWQKVVEDYMHQAEVDRVGEVQQNLDPVPEDLEIDDTQSISEDDHANAVAQFEKVKRDFEEKKAAGAVTLEEEIMFEQAEKAETTRLRLRQDQQAYNVSQLREEQEANSMFFPEAETPTPEASFPTSFQRGDIEIGSHDLGSDDDLPDYPSRRLPRSRRGSRGGARGSLRGVTARPKTRKDKVVKPRGARARGGVARGGRGRGAGKTTSGQDLVCYHTTLQSKRTAISLVPLNLASVPRIRRLPSRHSLHLFLRKTENHMFER